MCWRMVYTSILRHLPMALVDGLVQCYIRKSLQTDWKHVAYVRNMYDVRTNGDRAIFDCDLVCYG